MKRHTVSMLKFALLCMVFVSTPFMLSWTLSFFFPIQDYPVDYMHMKEEAALPDSDFSEFESTRNFAQFDENSKQNVDIYDPRIYMVDKNGPVYNDVSQSFVDYIAEHLEIRYEVLNNFAKYYKYAARLSLRNNGSEVIKANNWSIYLFHLKFIEPTHIKSEHYALVDDGQFNITHIDGSLYKMTPTAAYVDILPGEIREIILNNDHSMVARTDAFPNWYVCTKDSSPRIIASTQDEDLKFVGDFGSMAKWKRSAADLFDPYTPDKRFFLNADAHDHGQANKLVIPTPLNLTKTGDMLNLSDKRWSVVFSDDLVMEANLLSGEQKQKRPGDADTKCQTIVRIMDQLQPHHGPCTTPEHVDALFATFGSRTNQKIVMRAELKFEKYVNEEHWQPAPVDQKPPDIPWNIHEEQNDEKPSEIKDNMVQTQTLCRTSGSSRRDKWCQSTAMKNFTLERYNREVNFVMKVKELIKGQEQSHDCVSSLMGYSMGLIVHGQAVQEFGCDTAVGGVFHPATGQLDIPIRKDQPLTHFIHIRVGFVSLPATSGHLISDEAYSIETNCDKNIVRITGTSAAGVFYGVQTLDSIYNHNKRTIHCLDVVDAPRFSYRGIMLDVARNFFPVYEVIRILDTMAMYKLNVLHFHLSDDQGWRLEIPGLEELTRIGAHRNHNFTLGLSLAPSLGSGPFSNNSGSGFYTVQDYRMILRHAKSRHVQVIPEFDMPGHMNSALVSMEARYRRLYMTNMEEATKYQLIDPNDKSSYIAPEGHRLTTLNPCMESTYNFVEKIISTLKTLHQDIMPLDVYHLGGDEVPVLALNDSPICQRFMVQYPYYNSTTRLREYFVHRLVEIAKKLQVKVQAWEDGLLDSMKFPFRMTDLKVPQISVNLWNNIWENGRGHRTAIFANSNYKVILSHATHLYFDHPQEPDPEERGLYWARRFINTQKVFSFQPEHIYNNMDEEILGRQILKNDACTPGGMVDCIPVEKPENIIGMEGNIWSELIRTTEQLESMLYPRMLAMAERAWHRASWEGIVDDHVRERLRLEDWELFANSLGHRELSRLEGMKINYYLPPPGAVVMGGTLKVNTMFPGMIVQYSINNGTTWSDVLPDMKFDAGVVLLATRSYNLLRRGRSIPVEIHY
ncbi:hypothetical protein LSH36_1259g00011 [Paralvinella palmiformis]|uniref:beta-N-acetylhexosaminidase n=1 Tax=Paralvinella palmiformis TaxID=53620 RepID=A0AAD9MNY4_9ANNE|nr:hypothetical protein LSH36_1259g00011 [Paralvinella palmiformis]